MAELIINKISGLFFTKILGIPFLVLWYFGVAIFLMIKLRFINITKISEAIKTIFHQDQNKDKKSAQVSPLTALASQMASNLGISNIAGAAIAVKAGGPGVILWILIAAFLFSIIKFCEICLGHKYRTVNKNGFISGGMFFVIDNASINQPKKYRIPIKIIATILALITAGMMTFWSAFQTNQMIDIMHESFIRGFFGSEAYNCMTITVIATAFISIFTTIVLIGGVTRLGAVCDAVVPFMAVAYLVMSGVIIHHYSENIIPAIRMIFDEAFGFKTTTVGVGYTVIVAIQRMMFAAEAGLGTAAIMHSSSNIKTSCREGFLAFIDCLVIAIIISIGGLALVISGVDYQSFNQSGMATMNMVFSSVHKYFSYGLAFVAILFGITSVLGNGHCARNGMTYLFGPNNQKIYIFIYIVIFTVFSFIESKLMIKFIDTISLILILPITVSVIALSSVVKKDVNDYFKKTN